MKATRFVWGVTVPRSGVVPSAFTAQKSLYACNWTGIKFTTPGFMTQYAELSGRSGIDSNRSVVRKGTTFCKSGSRSEYASYRAPLN